MSLWDAQERALWAASKRAGMLITAQWLSSCPGAAPEDLDIELVQPDVGILGGNATSREFEIEYPHENATTLAQGDQLVMEGKCYRVRVNPYIPGEAPTGYFRRTLLSKAEPGVVGP